MIFTESNFYSVGSILFVGSKKITLSIGIHICGKKDALKYANIRHVYGKLELLHRVQVGRV